MNFDFEAIPTCGVLCLVGSLSASTCAPKNDTCLCQDVGFNNIVEHCVRANCSVVESLVVKNITWTDCGYHVVDRLGIMHFLQIFIFNLQTFSILLRMVARVALLGSWGADDTTICISWVFTTAYLAAGIVEERNGFGKDAWTLQPEQITEFVKIFLVFEILYAMTIGMIKTSICLLYIRVFPDRKFQRVVWATILFNFLLVFSFITADFLQCQPLSYFWENWDGEHHGHCVNLSAFAWSHAVINIVLDVWMLILPATQVWNMQMPVRKKLGVMLMFGMGIFATIISFIRLKSLVMFTATTNPTNDFFDISLWSGIEITVAIILACMPAVRMVAIKYTPKAVTDFFASFADRLMATFSRSGSASSTQNSSESGGVHKPRGRRRKSAAAFPAALQTIGGSDINGPELDKLRRYSARFTVTSPRNKQPVEDSEIELIDQQEEGEGKDADDGRDVEDGLESRKHSVWRHSSPAEASSSVWVQQDVSVSSKYGTIERKSHCPS